MSAPYPIEDRIYVLKDGESLGPFEIDEPSYFLISTQTINSTNNTINSKWRLV